MDITKKGVLYIRKKEDKKNVVIYNNEIWRVFVDIVYFNEE